jgi:hypothetical protein
MAALTRLGERNASDRVIRIDRSLLFSRAAIDSMVCVGPLRSSSNQRCALRRALVRTRRALVGSGRVEDGPAIGRWRCPWDGQGFGVRLLMGVVGQSDADCSPLQSDALDAGTDAFVIVRQRVCVPGRRNIVARKTAARINGLRLLILAQAADRLDDPALDLRRRNPRNGPVTLSNQERDPAGAHEFSGDRDRRPPRVHRCGAEDAVRLG